MNNAMLTLPLPAEADATPAYGVRDDDFERPGWLYRSEAFAEDLAPVDAPTRIGVGVLAPARLYAATLACAVLALPAACLIA